MKPIPSHKTQTGSFLLEALISVVIFAMGLIALVGMSAQAINMVGQAKYRNDASYLANEIIGEIWVNGLAVKDYDSTGSGTASDAWQDRVEASLPGGVGLVCTSASGAPCGDPTDNSCPAPSTLAANEVCLDIHWNDKDGVVHHYLTSDEIGQNS